MKVKRGDVWVLERWPCACVNVWKQRPFEPTTLALKSAADKGSWDS